MQTERETIDKWFDTYHFKPEIVKEALRRTTKPSVNYVDGILTRWHDAGMTTLDAVRQEAEDFRKNAGAKVPAQPTADADTRQREDLIDALADQDTQALWSLIDEQEELKSRDDH
jgi:DnaD/phage-associated family protein